MVMVRDQIGDSITRIRNGQQKKLMEISVLRSKFTLKVLDCLYNEGFIRGYYFNKLDNTLIQVLLKYDEYQQPIIRQIVQVSKPSRRVYVPVNALLRLYQQNSFNTFFIISTNLGVISYKKALELNVGGEIICKIL